MSGEELRKEDHMKWDSGTRNYGQPGTRNSDCAEEQRSKSSKKLLKMLWTLLVYIQHMWQTFKTLYAYKNKGSLQLCKPQKTGGLDIKDKICIICKWKVLCHLNCSSIPVLTSININSKTWGLWFTWILKYWRIFLWCCDC